MGIPVTMTVAERETANESRKEKVDAALKSLESAVAELATQDGWRRMLEAAAMFHNYSLNNSLLIMSECARRGIDYGPAAGFHTWRKLGRAVLKGQKGIPILAPMMAKREVVNAETGRLEEKRVLVGFRVVYVWVAAQTDGDPLPDMGPELLTGDGPASLLDALASVTTELGYELEWGPCGGANGYTNFDRHIIRVRDDVDAAQQCKTLAHELGHVLCGHDKDTDYHTDRACRGRCEVEAESVAYVVMHWAGADSSSYTVPYVAGWAGGDSKKVAAAADRVRKAGIELIEKVGALIGDEWLTGAVLGTD